MALASPESSPGWRTAHALHRPSAQIAISDTNDLELVVPGSIERWEVNLRGKGDVVDASLLTPGMVLGIKVKELRTRGGSVVFADYLLGIFDSNAKYPAVPLVVLVEEQIGE